ncbi:substrate-binding periplasmic protein [Saccharospirillum salsuginis]|nr:transporter substrate-binding domain-containing protein [Saccharospirillum salsuginis]
MPPIQPFSSSTVSALLFALSMTFPTWADGPLHVVTEEFPPYNHLVDGEAHGLSTEVVQAVLDHAGVDADIDFYPWARAYQIAQAEPNTLIYSIALIPEREPLFEWIGVIAPYRTSFYKLKSNTDLTIQSLEDARPYRIGVSQEDVIKTYLENRGFERFEITNDDDLIVRMLYFGRMELIAHDEAAMPIRVKAAGFDMALIERAYRIDDLTGSLYMAMHPDSDPDLIRALRDSLAAIKANGTYEAILSRYFPE